MEVPELGSTEKTTAAPAEKAAKKETLKKGLHPNERVILNTKEGYQFVRVGKSGDVVDGVVLYRSDEAHDLFHEENEKHAAAPKEQRFPIRGGY